jgi:transcriptional/translational regulatory protein YebC/TACO1
MSGHSKWATIKRAKGKADAARGKLFTVLSEKSQSRPESAAVMPMPIRV